MAIMLNIFLIYTQKYICYGNSLEALLSEPVSFRELKTKNINSFSLKVNTGANFDITLLFVVWKYYFQMI